MVDQRVMEEVALEWAEAGVVVVRIGTGTGIDRDESSRHYGYQLTWRGAGLVSGIAGSDGLVICMTRCTYRVLLHTV